MLRIELQEIEKKPSVDLVTVSGSLKNLESGIWGGKEAAGTVEVEWDRLLQYHQSAKVSPVLKVGVPSIAEASRAYSGPPLVTLTLWTWSLGPNIHRNWKMAASSKLSESPQVRALRT